MEPEKNFYIVGIGASAGGIDALTDFFNKAPLNPNIAYVVIMHVLRDHVSMLDHIIGKVTTIPIIRVSKNTTVKPGHIYLIVENTYLTIKDGILLIREREKSAINQAVDIFFESLSIDFGKNAIGIVLSGVGSDGLKGVKHIEDRGGFVLVQQPDSAQFNGMPMSIITFDHPDVIDTPARLSTFVTNYVNSFI